MIKGTPIDVAVQRQKVALGECILCATDAIKFAEKHLLDAVLYCQTDDIQKIQVAINGLTDVSNSVADAFYSAIDVANNQRNNSY